MRKAPLVAVGVVALCMAGPLAAHHAAEGVVSDEIYDAISVNLEGTPHLEMDMTTVGTSRDAMNVITVTLPETEVDEVLMSVADALAGQGDMVESSLDVEITAADDFGLVTVTIMEELGAGESQPQPAMP
ncbi:hypothetical protein [uncultured Thiohalocapsa sp.]|uniref:hypothetical protein n=1 Tax=uncultured Thiohalocapsa sp. TaxID=768990 RepID=UPI0025E88359|nr:hypothetical protein [uncultured Thiohalocapsa sp.]